MADLSITIANATSALGMSPPTLWNAANWGAFNWGYTGDLPLVVTKGVAETMTPADAQGVDVTHPIGETVTPADAQGVSFDRTIAESVTFAGEAASETLADGSGYNYVFPDRTTDAEERDFPTWTSGAAGSAAWTSATVTSTSWS